MKGNTNYNQDCTSQLPHRNNYMELLNLIGEKATNVLFGPNPQDTCGIDTPNGGVVITHMRKVVKTF
jgi:hypothetical protein